MPLPTASSAPAAPDKGSSADNHSSTMATETADKLIEAGRSKGAGTVATEPSGSQAEADRLYEEAIEEEYAKREGGA